MSAAQEPIFHSATSELVVLPTSVVDHRGQIVGDLTDRDFVVYDNGRPQPIAVFSPRDTPVAMALVIDDSGSMHGKLGEVVAASMALSKASNPDDELFVIEFNDSVRDALGGRSLSASDAPELEAALRTLVPQGRTALYDGLLDGLEHVQRSALARKVIVLVSDGGDNSSDATLDRVLERARQANVTLYTIGIFERDDADANAGVLKHLAETTGGERFLPESPGVLIQACQHIAREIRSGYTIAFAPPEHDGKYHRVRVDVSTADGRRMVVKTRPGYLATGEAAR